MTINTKDGRFSLMFADGKSFTFLHGDHDGVSDLDREQLTELRHIIDQALNTSAEELGDVE